MSDGDWDADDFEPVVKPAGPPAAFKDKWEGEDEDDDVKASWDASSEEEGDSKGSEEGKAFQKKKKKKLHEILAEKEAAKELDEEEKAALKAEKEFDETPEGKAAAKLGALKVQEENERQIMGELLGSGPPGSGPPGSIDGMVPSSKDDFDILSKAITEKVQMFNQSKHYNDFLEALVKDLALDLPATQLKQVKIHVETLHSTKVKAEQSAKKGKGKKGSTIKLDRGPKDTGDFGGGGLDEDDFM